MARFKRILSMLLAVILCVGVLPIAGISTTPDGLDNFVKRNSFKSDIFADVTKSDWFYDDVQTAYELGLMLGKGENAFDTESGVTIAETITIAARIHSIYYTGSDAFEADTPWYKVYADYAYANGIFDYNVTDYAKPATRAEFVSLLAKALPTAALEDINKVADNAIPDVKTTDACGAAVYKLYRAGIMIGNDKAGTFAPDSEIRRSEVAAIVSRMADKSLRKSIQLGAEYTVTFDMNGTGKQVPAQTILEGCTVEKPVDPENVAYIFKGWYTQKSGGSAYNFSAPVYSDLTLYARWEMNPVWMAMINGVWNNQNNQETSYTVSFESNGGTTVDSQTVNPGEKASYPEDPSREGYVFAGWFLNKNETEYTNVFDFGTVIESDITLYAVWISVTDTDKDGLYDDLEKYFGSDKDKPDTDGDGLNDYVEVWLQLSPVLSDTDNNGIADGDEDFDADGLSNLEEVRAGSDPAVMDTDEDGLNDGDEKIYGTDVLDKDTDGDGASDGWEVANGFDPLVKNDSFDVQFEAEGDDSVKASVKINLPGDQAETLKVAPVNNKTLFPEEIPGYLGKAYNFTVDGSFDSAEIQFEFDASLLSNPDFDPVIYYFNEEEQELEEQETIINGNVASTVVPHFSTYILINRTIYEKSFKWIDVWESDVNYTGVEIVLVIDDSGSMTSNDRNNQRLSVAKNLIDKLPANSKIGIVHFEYDADLLTTKLTDNRDTAKSYLTTEYFESYGGTYMYTAIESAFSLFESKDKEILKMMVVLSDGSTSDTSKHSSVISTATKSDVKIYTVGLGNSTSYFNNYLKPLASSTGGVFYLASNASELTTIYEDITDKIDLNADTDDDRIKDYYEDNMIAFNGVSIFLDKNNPDTDGDGIPDGEEIVLEYKYSDDNTKVCVVGKMYSNPSKIDSDDDGFDDTIDKTPLHPIYFENFDYYKQYKYGEATTLTIFVDQPYRNSRNVINFDDPDEYVGHTFVGIDYGKDGEEYAGFWPYIVNKDGTTEGYGTKRAIMRESVDGLVRMTGECYVTGGKNNEYYTFDGNEKDHKWDVAYTYSISSNKIGELKKFSKDYTYQYNMVSKNCTTFAVDALKALGISPKIYEHNWTYTLGEDFYSAIAHTYRGYSPADAGEDIRANYSDYIYFTDVELKDGTIVEGIFDMGYSN